MPKLSRTFVLIHWRAALLLGLVPPILGVAFGGAAYAQSRTYTVLHSFSPSPKGTYPNSVLTRDPAGNLFGVTSNEGTGYDSEAYGLIYSGTGTVFKLSPSGALTVLYAFPSNITDGASPAGDAVGALPIGGVVLDATGNLYGTTVEGGLFGFGVVFQISPAGAIRVLHDFAGGSDGRNPNGGLLMDSAGNLYGTTGGGSSNAGTVFKLDPEGNETIIYSFAGGEDGAGPTGFLVFDGNGNLIGTTAEGGSQNFGTVYRLSLTGAETVLHAFTGSSGGYSPTAGLAIDSSGNIYGTTENGGSAASASGYGVVFRLDAQNNFSVLYAFQGGDDAGHPSSLVRDESGNIYGTAATERNADSHGAVFKIGADGQESILFTFGTGSGADPIGLIVAPDGNFYGVTSRGGSSGKGGVYSLTPEGQQTVLYTFPGSRAGFFPSTNLAFNSSGDLCGVNPRGGDPGLGFGTLYEISLSGIETVLYDYNSAITSESSGLVFDVAGNAYGEEPSEGEYYAGSIYKVTPNGRASVLFSFGESELDGVGPSGGLTMDSTGNLYGVAAGGYGSLEGNGVIFKVDPSGKETVLHRFLPVAGGAVGPNSKPVFDSAGNLYGTTISGGAYNQGAIYELSPIGNLRVLYSFTGGVDGGYPIGVVIDRAGNLYGATNEGGVHSEGVVFKISGGVETTLLNFGGIYGINPYPIVADAGGNVFGTTLTGGKNNFGLVFEISAEGAPAILHEFTGTADGGAPLAGLLIGPSGILYGTAAVGGKYNGGVVFELQ